MKIMRLSAFHGEILWWWSFSVCIDI